MDSSAYLLPRICQITQLSSTFHSVITLGHKANEPLMCPASELAYGLEPHGLICSAVPHPCTEYVPGSGMRGVPGVACSWVDGRSVVPTQPPTQSEARLWAYLRNI